MNTPQPHVLISPAMGVPARFYGPLVEAFTELGWSAAVVPRRGIEPGAAPPSRRNDWSYADEARDLADAVTALRTSHADRPVIVLGHSLGAQLCALLVTDPDLAFGRPDAVVTVAGSVPWFRCYPSRGLVYYLTAAAVPVVTAIEGRWPARLFGGPTPRTLMREWAAMVRTGTPPIPDAQPETPPVPTLAVRLADDALVSVDAAQLLERHFPDGALETWTYARESCPPGGSIDHVRWARTPGPVVDRVVQWWTTQTTDHHGRVSVRRRR